MTLLILETRSSELNFEQTENDKITNQLLEEYWSRVSRCIIGLSVGCGHASFPTGGTYITISVNWRSVLSMRFDSTIVSVLSAGAWSDICLY